MTTEFLIPTTTPTAGFFDNSTGITFGSKWSSAVNGSVSSVRIWPKSTSGSTTMFLWNATGTLLYSGTITWSTAATWTSQSVGTPVPITASAIYYVGFNSTPSPAAGIWYVPSGVFPKSNGADLQIIQGYFSSGYNTFPTSQNSTACFCDVGFDPSAGGSTPPQPIVKWQDAVRRSYLY